MDDLYGLKMVRSTRHHQRAEQWRRVVELSGFSRIRQTAVCRRLSRPAIPTSNAPDVYKVHFPPHTSSSSTTHTIVPSSNNHPPTHQQTPPLTRNNVRHRPPRPPRHHNHLPHPGLPRPRRPPRHPPRPRYFLRRRRLPGRLARRHRVRAKRSCGCVPGRYRRAVWQHVF